MPLMRRGPGLVGAAARTAVVAGTATAVSGRVSRRQQQRYAQQEYEQQEGYAQEQQAYAPPPAPAAAPADPDDPIAQIEKLGALQQQGLLTPEEFAAMKAKILAG